MKNFKELTIPLQKRRIVKDAIKQITMGVVTPVEGTYFGMLDTFETKNLQTILQLQQENTCEACAKGALFAACVLSVDRVKTTENLDSNKFQVRKLKKWFSRLELNMIEAAFEKEIIDNSTGELYDENCDVTSLGKKCIEFGEQFDSDTDRLLAILNNVLENKTFKP